MTTTSSCGIDWCDTCQQAADYDNHHHCPGKIETRMIKGKPCTFREWFERVDSCVLHISHGAVGVADLPDFCSWDSWNARIAPATAALDLLQSEGFED